MDEAEDMVLEVKDAHKKTKNSKTCGIFHLGEFPNDFYEVATTLNNIPTFRHIKRHTEIGCVGTINNVDRWETKEYIERKRSRKRGELSDYM